eukprot:12200969-Karenia_brevis.AAC.1
MRAFFGKRLAASVTLQCIVVLQTTSTCAIVTLFSHVVPHVISPSARADVMCAHRQEMMN